MTELLRSPAASVVLLLTVTAVLVAIGVYVVGRVRRDLRGETAPASDLLAKFREMHSQGELSDEEYRTIKAMLADRLEQELKDTVQKK